MRNLFYISIFIIFNFLSLFIYQLKAASLQLFINDSTGNKTKELKDINKKIFTLRTTFNNHLKKDIINSESKLLNILLSLDKNKFNNFSLDIESDTQYFEGDLFYAENNVIINFSEGRLEADKVSYDKVNKIFKASGNIKFYKGGQYFEATAFSYNLKEEEGYIKDIYGLLNLETINKDFELKIINDSSKDLSDDRGDVDQFFYVNKSSLGIFNNFEDILIDQFRPSDFSKNSTSFSKLRFKSEQLNLTSNSVYSDLVLFTNDPINKPQFILESRNFNGQIVDKKPQLISKNTWIVFDDLFKFPIGKRNIIDSDLNPSWGIGSDFSEKDGWYLFKDYQSISLSNKFSIQFTPYVLFQRALKDSTNSYREKGSSIFSPKITDENIDISDLFALDYQLQGDINNWKLSSSGSLNSLNSNRLNESLRHKISLSRTIDLQSKVKDKHSAPVQMESINIKNKDLNQSSIFIKQQSTNKNNKRSFRNYLDLQIYNTFREKVSKGYYDESEIYFGSGFSVINRKLWNNLNWKNGLSLIYDFGHFNSKINNANQLNELFRNLFAFEFDNKYQIWTNEKFINKLAEDFKYTPVPIVPSLYWGTNIQGGLFSYSNNISQKVIGLNIGPELLLGNRIKNWLDYTYIDLKTSFFLKDGESPFTFDNLSSTNKLNFNIKQQIYGPLIFGYSSYLNLQLGTYEDPKYTLEINRRAYSIGAFYNQNSKTVGIKFNIFNFVYDGVSPRF